MSFEVHCLPVQNAGPNVEDVKKGEAERGRKLQSMDRIHKKRQQEEEQREAQRNEDVAAVRSSRWHCSEQQ
jgi:hypothetical protein